MPKSGKVHQCMQRNEQIGIVRTSAAVYDMGVISHSTGHDQRVKSSGTRAGSAWHAPESISRICKGEDTRELDECDEEILGHGWMGGKKKRLLTKDQPDMMHDGAWAGMRILGCRCRGGEWQRLRHNWQLG